MEIDELKTLIKSTVYEAMDEYIEDLAALNSNQYLDSIKEAREEYKAGNFVNLEELIGV
jgi:hypothetical protein